MSPKKSISDQFEEARLLFSVAQSDEEAATLLAGVNYSPEALAEGQALYDATVDTRTAVMAAHGNQLTTTRRVNTLREQADNNYKALARMARAAFAGDIKTLETLGLRTRGRLSRSQAAFLDRSRLLYNAALGNPVILEGLSQVGYSQERLEAEQAVIRELEAADVEQERYKAEYKVRVGEQRTALEALKNWVSRFKQIVRAAYPDRPGLLRKLGL